MIIIVIVALICLLFAHYMWQRERNRKAEEHERRMERFERLMELLKKQNSNKNDEVNDSTSLDNPDSHRDKS